MSRLERIAYEYEQGSSLLDIKKKFNTSSDTIYKALDKFNIPRKTFKDLSVFKDLTNKELMYWLGFIVADGSINIVENQRVYRVVVHNTQLELIEMFKKFTKGIKVSVHTRYYKTNSGNVIPIYNAYISSKELAYLFKDTYNIPVKDKAFVCDPNIAINSSFLLGLFDGDGSVRDQSKGVRHEAKLTTANPLLLKRIVTFLSINGIDTIINKKGKAFDINIYNKMNLYKFYKLLYEDNLPCLSYKKERFVALFGNL